MKKLFTSPKTTWAALLGLLTLIITNLAYTFDGDPLTDVDWSVVVPQLLSLVGVIFARDNNVSSEEAGIKPIEATKPAVNA